MANITTELNKIMAAIYGEEVRGSIYSGIEKINNEVEENTAIANSANTKADNAISTANAANSKATEANTKADNAISTANAANSKATEANTKADNAISTANAANSKADNAITTATEANSKADNTKNLTESMISMINVLSEELNDLNDSPDPNLNQLSEIVAFIKQNRTAINNLTDMNFEDIITDVVKLKNDLQLNGILSPYFIVSEVNKPPLPDWLGSITFKDLITFDSLKFFTNRNDDINFPELNGSGFIMPMVNAAYKFIMYVVPKTDHTYFLYWDQTINDPDLPLLTWNRVPTIFNGYMDIYDKKNVNVIGITTHSVDQNDVKKARMFSGINKNQNLLGLFSNVNQTWFVKYLDDSKKLYLGDKEVVAYPGINVNSFSEYNIFATMANVYNAYRSSLKHHTAYQGFLENNDEIDFPYDGYPESSYLVICISRNIKSTVNDVSNMGVYLVAYSKKITLGSTSTSTSYSIDVTTSIYSFFIKNINTNYGTHFFIHKLTGNAAIFSD